MSNFFLLKWIRDVSIAKKLYFMLGIMALLIAFELLMLVFTMHTLSSTRTLVGAEGLWSKAQKNASYYLQKYGLGKNENDYLEYLHSLKVPLGDSKARHELLKQNPDLSTVRQGFIEGRIHKDDIEGTIKLLRRFSGISYISKAIVYWTEGDSLMTQLQDVGFKLHQQVLSLTESRENINATLDKVDLLNRQLTVVEDRFSYTLGEGSRWLEKLILKLLFIIALTVEFTGLFLTISVSVGISKGINEVMRVSAKVAKADFSDRAKKYSEDEIGILAASFNTMINSLERMLAEQKEAEEKLKAAKDAFEKQAKDLARSNADLEQFAYISSHDLQEPLRTIVSYLQLLEKRFKNKFDKEADEFINFAVDGAKRMHILINDLLTYSRIGTNTKVFDNVDCTKVMTIVLNNLDNTIRECKAQVILENPMPVIMADQSQIIQLFQNLIENAIKYRRNDEAPEIKVSAHKTRGNWTFSVSDNGIGIAKEYSERIFVIFQRLHTREKYAGTGIGLALCKKIVERHGGRIWVEPGKSGSIFYFTIPAKLS